MKKILPIFLLYTFLLTQLIFAQDLSTQSDEKPIKTHVGVRVLKNAIKPLSQSRPTMEWLNPEDVTTSETFVLQLETKSPYPIKAIKVKIEDKEVRLDKLSSLRQEVKRKIKNSRGISNDKYDYQKVSRYEPLTKEVFELPLVLKDGENSIQIVVMNEGGMVEDTVFQTSYESLPALHLVTIGVGKYIANQLRHPGAPKDLKYAAIDAESIRDMFMQSDQKDLFSDVKSYHLVNESATKNAIDLLIKQKLKNAVKPGDIVILFLAAHGEQRENEPLQFLPYDFDPDNKGLTGVDAEGIKTWIEALECNSLLIFDACQSGRALTSHNLVSRGRSLRADKVPKIVKANYIRNERKKVILTASSDLAYEHEDWGHGALTKAILEVLSGEVDSRFLPISKSARKGMSKNGKLLKTKKLMKRIIADGIIDIKELIGYVEHRVPELVSQKKANQMPAFEGDSDLFIFQLNK